MLVIVVVVVVVVELGVGVKVANPYTHSLLSVFGIVPSFLYSVSKKSKTIKT